MPDEETNFINNYVNCVYGIVLGFGFVHIIEEIFSEEYSGQFTLSFSFQIFYQLVMALFVIIVVCLYWWDWVENINNQAKSTFLELIIDMGIGFTLLLILFSFNDSLGLIKLFIILSIFNLGWVINFSKDKGYTKEKKYKWIGQKFLAIFIYGIAMYVIISGKDIPIINDFLIWLPIFFSFMLVRLFCFSERPIDK